MYNNPYYNMNTYNQTPRYQQIEPQQQPINNQAFIQPIQNNNQPILLGKSVESIDVVKAMEIPLDGSTSYFPLADNSAIITKKIQADGTSKITIYKPIEEEKKEMPKYVTLDDFNKRLSDFEDIDFDEIKEELKSIRKELKELKTKKSKED